jgi:glycine/D-amino acid oxidase-like deaminating enzyme
MRQLEEFCRGADQMGEPYEVLDAARLEAITGMSYFRAAVRTPGAAMVQPAALVRGLAAALPPSVELYEESPVRTYNGVGVAMGTISGTLLADLVVGADSGLLREIQALPGPTWVPPEPLLGIGVRFTLTRMQARAGAEL